jgi:hypothetical protein
VDSKLQDGTLLNSTESRNRHIQIDSSPMTNNDRNMEFKSSLRNDYYHSHDTHDNTSKYPSVVIAAPTPIPILSSNKSYSNNENNRNRIYANKTSKSSDSFQESSKPQRCLEGYV